MTSPGKPTSSRHWRKGDTTVSTREEPGDGEAIGHMGKSPQPPSAGPRPDDRIDLSDEESRIMPVAGGDFDQCDNEQAAIARGSLLVVVVTRMSDVSRLALLSHISRNARRKIFPTLSFGSSLQNSTWRGTL